ncbi:hypothetical protein ABZ471_02505 [Streptomyces sp. NPDC005728]|uniref:hypothetical protein n=1 Tax=Streptomyces sp. NPDC005728 TaxID=3157054 RepID=UPI0033D62664
MMLPVWATLSGHASVWGDPWSDRAQRRILSEARAASEALAALRPDLSMDEYGWLTGPEVLAADAVRERWAATVTTLPVGTQITGEVIGRRRFGVFIRMDGVPDAIALAEITAMPQEMDLPPLGASVSGEVFWHAYNHQVRVRLDEWRAAHE